ncbi:hypothetical protein F441_00386 [Phytophthora nicotianae CJ01A1]|uniref:PiggyBac transposable element-derived protein domain-containing protein n=1 Tax=Phytophthora nicotianae CJ01A1 TaxID=1317063 RepID=W2XW16_PHYNI|nr:hypothetical protein F441_00386 [Phytophthora nicotianae CJ01A1]
MEWLSAKEFKAFWRKLVKSGWKARRPRDLSVDYTYVKPGVTGKLDDAERGENYFVGTKELEAFARRTGLLPPAEPVETLSSEAIRTLPETVQPSAARTKSSRRGSREPAARAARPTTPEPVSASPAEASESAESLSTEYPTQVAEIAENPSDDEEEEAKRDEGSADDVAVFDTENFMEALRSEQLFGPVPADDVNVCTDDDQDADDDDDDAEDDGDALGVPAASLEYESEVESDSDFEDDSDAFAQDDDAMRGLRWRVFDQNKSDELQLSGATDLYSGSFGVTKSAAAYAKSPLGMFFYFLPKALWVHIASESDAYRVECIPAVAEMIRKKQLDAQAKDPSRTVQPIADITSKLERVKPIKPHEILHVVGLLAARTLCSHTDGLEKHWSAREDGAFSRGTFSRYMKRERFRIITRYLHFASNSTGGAAHDKAWKVRPVLQAVEKTFRRGYRLGARVSFDEGTIPNRSQFNPIRVYNKDKPHKYGTKCYMTCCAETGYCSRVEVYLGKAKDKKQAKGVAQKAVIRNLAKSFDGQPSKRLIIADNFYSSCALALELRDMGFYYVGTHRNDRLGWPKSLEFKQKKRPAYMPRGTYRIAQDVDHPELVAVAWMDSSPVHMIAIGCSTIPTSVTRRNKPPEV